MKTMIAFLVVVTAFSISVYSAVYVKGIHHFYSYYSYGVIHPEADLVNEWWFDKDKVSFITPDWQLTLDKQAQRILVMNRAEKTYTEIPLPLTISSHLEPSLLEGLQAYQMDGTIKATGKKETIDRKVCDVYEVSEGIIFQKGRFYDRDRRIFITTEVPFDWQLFKEMEQWIRTYFNPEESYAKSINQLSGFVLASQDIQISKGVKIQWRFQVTEISDKETPLHTFSIPEGFKKKDILSRDEIIGLRGTLYVYP
jgi:hypothetical protein